MPIPIARGEGTRCALADWHAHRGPHEEHALSRGGSPSGSQVRFLPAHRCRPTRAPPGMTQNPITGLGPAK
eukprot:scaffold2161_cov225-Prasinococcus_capsulatus_cf.AAC.3